MDRTEGHWNCSNLMKEHIWRAIETWAIGTHVPLSQVNQDDLNRLPGFFLRANLFMFLHFLMGSGYSWGWKQCWYSWWSLSSLHGKSFCNIQMLPIKNLLDDYCSKWKSIPWTANTIWGWLGPEIQYVCCCGLKMPYISWLFDLFNF